MRILVVEDEPVLQKQLRAELESQGYTVDATGEGKEALYFATEYPYDAAIIDLGLPGISGLEVIGQLRKHGSRLPILVLTARARWQDKVTGLETGADDYLTKPFQPEELQARLKALLRRAAGATRDRLRCGRLEIDFGAQKVLVDGREIELTSFEYRLLEHLARARPRVLSKEELAAHLYPHDEERDSNVIEVLIGRLRRKLDPDSRLQPLETLRGRGYRFALGDE
ncbi:MAG TPA: response regulator transcription factor [Burkholderiales bacterium]|jgi:two-component system response regulator PhoP|nr:response regulator transcription factor [Burkholderiales bacterium]